MSLGVRCALAVCAALVCVACGGGAVSTAGKVVDHRGEPVSKAEVVTEPETDIVVTNNRGFFVLRQRLNDFGETESIPTGVYKIMVRKFGFEDLAFEVSVEGGPTRVNDLVMKPRTPDIEETAPDVMDEEEKTMDDSNTPVQGT